MSFGTNSGNASALKGLDRFNCQPSNCSKFNRQPSRKKKKKTVKFQPSNFKGVLDLSTSAACHEQF